jgi:protein-S-isoprenylcysteine O-methyltransferase Ste14
VSEALTNGSPIAVPLTNTLNALTSASSARLNAVEDQVPGTVVLLLFVFALVTTMLGGFEEGNRGTIAIEEVVGILSFIVLVALAVFVTLDLDQPDRGLITVSQASIDRLVSSLAR